MGSPVEITFEQIRERAYELWERHHRPEGFQIEFWLMAERELKAERKRSAAARPDSTGPDARPRDDTIGQTGEGRADDGGRPVAVDDAESARLAQRMRNL